MSIGIAFVGQGRTLRAPVYAPPQPTEGDPSVSERHFVRGPHADGATGRPTTAIEEETSLQQTIFFAFLVSIRTLMAPVYAPPQPKWGTQTLAGSICSSFPTPLPRHAHRSFGSHPCTDFHSRALHGLLPDLACPYVQIRNMCIF